MKKKLKKSIIVMALILAMPFLVFAVNDFSLNGPVDFELLTTDTVVLKTFIGQSGGVVTSMNVQANYIDITLDNASSITLNTDGTVYFIITPQSGAGETILPACPTTSTTISSTANAVVRVQIQAALPGCAPIPPGGGGPPDIYPTFFSVNINQSAECTETQNVTLNLQAQNASHVVISDNPDFFNSQWEFFTNPTNKTWNLTGGDGIKAIYVMYKSITGQTSSVVSDSIELNSAGCLPTEVSVSVESTPPPPEEPVVPVGGLNFGNLIKGSLDTIYLYGEDGNRHSFPSRGTYDSWYNGDFSQVRTVPDELLSQIFLNSNMTYKPGVRMLKIQSVPEVYAVDNGAVLRWVVNERVAEDMYGPKLAKIY